MPRAATLILRRRSGFFEPRKWGELVRLAECRELFIILFVLLMLLIRKPNYAASAPRSNARDPDPVERGDAAYNKGGWLRHVGITGHLADAVDEPTVTVRSARESPQILWRAALVGPKNCMNGSTAISAIASDGTGVVD